MSEFRWIKTSLLLILVLQFTAAATGQLLLYVNVRDGDEATLPCNSERDDQENCDTTTWTFSHSRRPSVDLVKDGQIVEEAKAKSDRLSVSEKCSLVIKNVTDEDVGRYDCRQFRSGQLLGLDALVYLSVVTMTEDEDDDEVTLRCSVSAYLSCVHTVKWLLQGQDVDKDNTDLRPSELECYASLTFLTSHFIYTSRFNSLKCKVTEVTRLDKVQQFSFRNSPSGEKTGEDTITATTESTTTEDNTTAANTMTTSTIWWYIIVAVVLVALLIITVALIKWKRTKGNATRTDGNVGLTSNPAAETSQDTADPEEGVSYASVTFTKKTNGKAQGQSKHDDDDDAVTYATVKASSADPSNL